MTEKQSTKHKLDRKNTFWNRVQLIAVLVVFTAPLVAAFLYKPTKFNNYGEIYQPVRKVQNLQMRNGDESFEFDELRRQWIFLVVAQGQCDQECEFNLLKIRQLRHMQGKNMSRIRSVFIQSGMVEAVAKDLTDKYLGIDGYQVEADELLLWLAQMKRDDSAADSEKNRIYVIDPAGNLMMSYPADADPNRMKLDIKRLLKTSQIG